MKLIMFAVWDKKAEAYLPPFWQKNEAMAARIFIQACRDPEHNFGMNPEDYHLFSVCSFDDETGVVTPYMPLRPVVDGLQAVAVQKVPSESPVRSSDVVERAQEVKEG